MEVHAVSAALESPVTWPLIAARWSYCVRVLFIVHLWPDTDVDAAAPPRHISYSSMFRGIKNAIFDRTNRGGAGQNADNNVGPADTACYSESSGSEAANDRVLESGSSTGSSVISNPPDNPIPRPNNDNIMRPEIEDDATWDLGRTWHFTQYGYRQFEQRTITRTNL
jgi:hypothetical protein